MSTPYDRRRARREAERQRNLAGETLAEFHARENAGPGQPGEGIPRVRCRSTGDLFGAAFEHPAARQFNMGFALGHRRAR